MMTPFLIVSTFPQMMGHEYTVKHGKDYSILYYNNSELSDKVKSNCKGAIEMLGVFRPDGQMTDFFIVSGDEEPPAEFVMFRRELFNETVN